MCHLYVTIRSLCDRIILSGTGVSRTLDLLTYQVCRSYSSGYHYVTSPGWIGLLGSLRQTLPFPSSTRLPIPSPSNHFTVSPSPSSSTSSISLVPYKHDEVYQGKPFWTHVSSQFLLHLSTVPTQHFPKETVKTLKCEDSRYPSVNSFPM